MLDIRLSAFVTSCYWLAKAIHNHSGLLYVALSAICFGLAIVFCPLEPIERDKHD